MTEISFATKTTVTTNADGSPTKAYMREVEPVTSPFMVLLEDYITPVGTIAKGTNLTLVGYETDGWVFVPVEDDNTIYIVIRYEHRDILADREEDSIVTEIPDSADDDTDGEAEDEPVTAGNSIVA